MSNVLKLDLLVQLRGIWYQNELKITHKFDFQAKQSVRKEKFWSENVNPI